MSDPILANNPETEHSPDENGAVRKRYRRIINDPTRRDYVMAIVCMAIIILGLFASIKSFPPIYFDEIELVNGETVGQRIEAVQENLRELSFNDQEKALKYIDGMSARLGIADINQFYAGNMAALLFLNTKELETAYIAQDRNNRGESFGTASYTDEKPTSYYLLNASNVIHIFFVVVLLAMLVGQTSGIRNFAFNAIDSIISMLGMQIFWAVLFIISFIHLAIWGLVYMDSIPQFVRDLLDVLNLQAKDFNVEDIIGWEFFINMGVWTIVTFITAGSFLFRPKRWV